MLTPFVPDTTRNFRFSPSKADIWLNCAGSPRLCENLPRKTSVWADEGTAAHLLGKQCLLDGSDPAIYKGQTITLEDGSASFPVTAEMVGAVTAYVQEVRRVANGLPILVEFPVGLDPEIYGTADAIVIVPFDALYVFDLKYGANKAVEADHAQFAIYGAAALGDNAMMVSDVVATVIQPRCFHPAGMIRSFRRTVDELRMWINNTMYPATIRCKEAGNDIKAYLKAGSHCQFCPALEAAICPEVHKQSMDLVADSAPGMSMIPVTERSIEELVMIFQMTPIIKKYLTAVGTYLQQCIDTGIDVPGVKLVNKRSDRQWIDKQAVIDLLSPVYGSDVWNVKEPEFKSPAQIETMLGKAAFKGLAHLVVKPDAGKTIAMATDTRTAIIPTSDIAFAPISDNDLMGLPTREDLVNPQ